MTVRKLKVDGDSLKFTEDVREETLLGDKVMVGTMMVPVGSLKVDDDYQRDLNESRAARYARDWEPTLAGLVTVSARKDGTYAILDGQHRSKAAAIRGLNAVWSEVFFDLTPQQEAWLFKNRNRERVATNALSDFKASLAAGEDEATTILSILRSAGGDIQMGNGGVSRARNKFSAIGAIRTLYSWHVLGDTIKLTLEAWPIQNRAKEKPVLLAVGTLLYNYHKQIDYARFVRMMAVVPLASLIGNARALRETSSTMTEWQHLARLLGHEYNKRLTAEHRLSIDTMKMPPISRD